MMEKCPIHGKRILVLDEELEMRIFLSNLLTAGGLAPIPAASGVEGLQIARSVRPDLIVLEGTMGLGAGQPLFNQIRQNEALASIPIVLLSTLDEKTLLHYLRSFKGALPGPEAHLCRPPEAREFLEAVGRLTARKEA